MENVQGPKDGSQNLEKTLGVASPSTKTEKRLSDRPATADDLLGWLLELSALQGSIGMNGEWDQESFTDAFAMEFDEDGHLSGGLPGDASLSAALGRATCDWAREKYLVEVTGQHHALYPEMLARVDAKLRAGGVPETKIAKMTPKARLIKYASLDRGPAAVGRSPKPPRFFVYVISTKDPTGNIKDHRRLSFPRDVCFGQFLGVLRDMTAYAAERTGHRGGGYMLCDGPWYYNLIDLDNNVVLDAPRMEIVDEESFELMLLQVRNKDTPGISIFHSLSFQLFSESINRSSRPINRSRGHIRINFGGYSRDDDHVDENGEPYFKDKIDWKQIIRSSHHLFDDFLDRPAEPGAGAGNRVGNEVGNGAGNGVCARGGGGAGCGGIGGA